MALSAQSPQVAISVSLTFQVGLSDQGIHPFAMSPVVRLPKPPAKQSEVIEKGESAKQLQQFYPMSSSKQHLQSD